MLEYVSDGLEYIEEIDIKIVKKAEIFVQLVNYNLMFPMSPLKVPMYEKRLLKKLGLLSIEMLR
jgi:hypothetical protein